MKLQASIVHEMNRKNTVEIKKGCIKNGKTNFKQGT